MTFKVFGAAFAVLAGAKSKEPDTSTMMTKDEISFFIFLDS
jgi:hypothetical protein